MCMHKYALTYIIQYWVSCVTRIKHIMACCCCLRLYCMHSWRFQPPCQVVRKYTLLSLKTKGNNHSICTFLCTFSVFKKKTLVDIHTYILRNVVFWYACGLWTLISKRPLTAGESSFPFTCLPLRMLWNVSETNCIISLLLVVPSAGERWRNKFTSLNKWIVIFASIKEIEKAIYSFT